jgi:hypothetical protein
VLVSSDYDLKVCNVDMYKSTLNIFKLIELKSDQFLL